MTIQKIAVNTLYQTFTRIVTSGVGFLITILIAKNFGTLGYGDFTKITAIVGIFYLAIDFGLNAFYLQRDEKENRFFTLLSFRVLLGVFLALFVSLISVLLPFSENPTAGFSSTVKLGIIIFSFSILGQAIILSASAIFQKYLQYHFLLIASLLGSIVSLFLVYIAINFSLGLYFVLGGLVIGGLLTGFTSLIFIKRSLYSLTFDKKFILNLLKESTPFGLMLLFNFIYFRTDTILLSVFRPTEEVGIYGLSYKFFDFLVALPLFLSNAIYPSLLSWQKNHRILFQNLKKFIFVFLVLSILTLSISWVMAPFISLVKKDFIPSILSFKILILSLPFFFLTNLFQWTLIVLKKQKFLLSAYLVAAILNIILNIIFIPFYGYIASAIITGVSEGFVLLLLIFQIILLRKNMQKGVRI